MSQLAPMSRIDVARFFDQLEPSRFRATRRTVIGFAHYLLHRSTWAPVCYCYLEDPLSNVGPRKRRRAWV